MEDVDFVDDTKDAGEIGSGHTVTALYEVIPTGVKSDYLKNVSDLKYTNNTSDYTYSEELFTVKFRYKQPTEDKSIEIIHVQADKIGKPSEDLKFASSVALFGMILRQSKYHNDASFEDVIQLAKAGNGDDEKGYKSEFRRLFYSYQQI